MIDIYWDPIIFWGPVPINWYGLNAALAFLAGMLLVRRWAPGYQIPPEKVDGIFPWLLIGTAAGARLYFVVQHPGVYLDEPWRILAVWEGGLAYFGGLLGAVLGAWLYTRRQKLSFLRMGDLFAPAILIGSGLGRISCGLAGMDYGTPTSLPWGVTYSHAGSHAPIDGIARHPAQFYELAGDFLLAGFLLRLRGRLPEGGLFLIYLLSFSLFRFFLFFFRGDVEAVALGLKNAQWTALVLAAAALAALISLLRRPGVDGQPA